MAIETVDLIEFMANVRPAQASQFKPCFYYGADEDALMFYFRSAPDYARRLNSRVTAYFSIDGDELVGCQIKGVRHVLNEIGTHDIEIRDNKTKLKLIFIAFLGTFADDPDSLKVYQEVRDAAGKVPESEVPEFA